MQTDYISGDLDFGIVFNTGTYYDTIKQKSGDGFVLMLDFNHSGPLPGKAQIQIYTGVQYAGKTLNYYYYNPQTGGLDFMQTGTVELNGYVTVTQSHCSSYVLTLGDDEKAPENPKTDGDSIKPLWLLLCGTFFAGIFTLILSGNRKRKRRFLGEYKN